MNEFAGAKFKYSWRDYQARIFEKLWKHLADNHIHVVAPPGSGKTVLGLELMRQLGQPTLIFAPTVTIRNQWVERYKGLFLPEGQKEVDSISTSLRDVRFITVATYQALHSLFRASDVAETEEEPLEDGKEVEPIKLTEAQKQSALDAFIKVLKAKGVKTIILDEAHHLRTEWWKALIGMKEKLGDSKIIALTATPPYDSEAIEWERYIELCGAIDEEIYVPELVANGDLCPHQDYIYLTTPNPEELERLKTLKEDLQKAVNHFLANSEFVKRLTRQPYIDRPEQFVETLLESPEYFASMMLYLKTYMSAHPNDENMVTLRSSVRQMEKILGLEKEKLQLTKENLEVLLKGIFFEDKTLLADDLTAPILKEIKREFTAAGAIDKRTISLSINQEAVKTMSQSVAKFEAIKNIVELEKSQMGEALRLIVLTDYIRKDEAIQGTDQLSKVANIGVIPIFDYLRLQATSSQGTIGILSGTYVVIPEKAKAQLLTLAGEEEIEEGGIVFKPLSYDSNYLEVTFKGKEREKMVHLITLLFENGGIKVLVGTQALLGEGWDAPCVNALILATFVGSYMLSNQMRGRAIRSYKQDPYKTSNIWHIVCVNPQEQSSEAQYDLELMTRRMKSFEGPAHGEQVIINGIERFPIQHTGFTNDSIHAFNETMARGAKNRSALAGIWTGSISKTSKQQMLSQAVVSAGSTPKSYVMKAHLFKNVLKIAFVFALCSILLYVGLTRNFFEDAGKAVMVALGIALALNSVSIIKVILLYIRHGSEEKSLKTVAKVIYNSLTYVRALSSSASLSKIKVKPMKSGLTCTLMSEEKRDQEVFIDALTEFMSPIDNPRYLIGRKSHVFSDKEYQAVPTLLSKNKEAATYFADQYQRYLVPAELIYTRTPEGRKLLLKARELYLSYHESEKIKRLKVWE